VIALGTADELKSRIGGERIEVQLAESADVPHAVSAMAGLGLAAPSVEDRDRRITLPVDGGSDDLVALLRRLDAGDIAVAEIGLRRPTLDDVFMRLTGHAAETAEVTGDPA
jgi:ABC-2 type transport system ATP-binding protein